MNLKKKLLKRLIILKTKRNQKIKIKKNQKKNNKKEKINDEPYKIEIKELKNDDELVKKQQEQKKILIRFYQFFGGNIINL